MAKINAINNIIKTFDGYFNIKYIDLVPHFQNPNGTLKANLYNSDNLHLAAPAYELWADIIIDEIEGK